MRLQGKVALVTGATGGIGEAITRRFAREGANVGVADLEETKVRALCEDIQREGGCATPYWFDVAEEADWIVTMADLNQRYGAINVLVNNAAMFARLALETLSVEDWDRLMTVNVRSVFVGTKTVIPYMRAAGGGSIINMSSIAGNKASFATHYGTSKGAVRLLTKSTAMQHGPENIRCNSVHPGVVLTSMGKESIPEDIRERRREALPLRRFGEPSEIANAVLFLASDEASYFTGSEVTVDGGATAV